jgi:hypothetical protein
MSYLRLLQLRRMDADGTGGGDNATEVRADEKAGAEVKSEEKSGDKAKTFTQEDLDRVITDRLKRERTKWEKETETKVSAAVTEAEKFAKMTAEQRAEAEREAREKKLADREVEITRRELRAKALEALAEKGLPKELAETLNYTDADSCNQSIESVEKAFRAAVDAAVNAKLRGNPPKVGDPVKTDYDKMTDAEYYSTTMKKG